MRVRDCRRRRRGLLGGLPGRHTRQQASDYFRCFRTPRRWDWLTRPGHGHRPCHGHGHVSPSMQEGRQRGVVGLREYAHTTGAVEAQSLFEERRPGDRLLLRLYQQAWVCLKTPRKLMEGCGRFVEVSTEASTSSFHLFPLGTFHLLQYHGSFQFFHGSFHYSRV